MESGRTIGSAELKSGLYIFNSPSRQATNQGCKASLSLSKSLSIYHSYPSIFNSNVNNEDEIMLWHFRLGHPNFMYLAKMFPALFINKNSNSFNCEVCRFAKHTRANFIQIPYIPTRPFTMIHSDV